MSHHASGPNFGFPHGDARLDMTDIYAFRKPGDPSKSIIVFDVHPSFRLDSPKPTTHARLKQTTGRGRSGGRPPWGL